MTTLQEALLDRRAKRVLTMLQSPGNTVSIDGIAKELNLTDRKVLGALTTIRHAGYQITVDIDLRLVSVMSAGWERVKADAEIFAADMDA